MSGEMEVIDPRLPARRCAAAAAGGIACRAAPARDSVFCFWHDPVTADQAAEALRLGGLRRRREKVVAAAYDIGPLDTVEGLQRVLEVAALDAAALDNSVARARILVAVVLAGARLLELRALVSDIVPPEGEPTP